MESEWFEVAYINFDEAILHGRMNAGRDDYGVNMEKDVRKVLSDEEKARVVDLNEEHAREMKALLRELATS